MASSPYPWYVRIFFFLQKRKYGQVLAPSYYWGRIPRLFFAMAHFYGAITSKRSIVTRSMKSLIMVRTSQINNCPFCVDLNSSIFLKKSAEIEKLQEISYWRSSELFNDSERLALEYAEAITDPNIGVSDQMRLKLRDVYTEDEIIELTAVIAYQNLSSKFNHAFSIESSGFCKTINANENSNE